MATEVFSQAVSGREDMQLCVKENQGLCWKCQALLNKVYPEGLVTTKTRTTQLEPDKKQIRVIKTTDCVETSAANGCLLCLHLLHDLGIPAQAALLELKQTAKGGTETPVILYEESIFQDEGAPPCFQMHVKTDRPFPGSEQGNEIKCLIQLFPTSEISSFVNHETVAANTYSDSSWSLVAKWVGQCTKTHKLCSTPLHETPALPSRVIDLGSEERIAPRLLLVNGGTPLLPYATLSHCWGTHLPFRLLSSNLSTLEKEIPVSHLSKSFQDALLVTRRLGLRYLWIDSLCIIQDSDSDWQEQSASMAQVYSNSYCNIAAAHATDGTHGCFVERNPDLVKPLKVYLNWGPHPGTYYAIQWLYWRKNVMHTPLVGRAWVCQERFLSPRNLYFGATQLYWECCEVSASESFPRGLPPGVGSPGLKGLDPHIDGARTRKELALPDNPDLNVFSLWNRVVSAYSMAKLTYSTDKLVALSGLAARIQKYTKCQYLAGMWRHHLAYQLLWEVAGIQWVVSRERREIYTAPSWSWASIHGHIEGACVIWHADDRDIVLDILEVGVELVSNNNRFGQVKSGFLRVRCSLAKAGVHVEESQSNQGSYELFISGLRAGIASLDFENRERERTIHEDFYYLPIRYNSRCEEGVRGGEFMSVPEVSGLILRSTGPEAQNFVRIGKFDVYGRNEFRSACRQYSKQLGKDEQSLGEWGQKWEILIL